MKRRVRASDWQPTVTTGAARLAEKEYWFAMISCEDGAVPAPTVEDDMQLFTGTKAKNRTNLPTEAKISNNSNFRIRAMSCFMFFDGTLSLEHYKGVHAQLFFKLSVNDRLQWENWARNIPAGGGLDTSFNGTSTTLVANNGVPQPQSIRRVAEPIVLGAGQEFELTAQFKNLGANSILGSLQANQGDRLIVFTMHGEELGTAS
jgi:hypothetical protein